MNHAAMMERADRAERKIMVDTGFGAESKEEAATVLVLGSIHHALSQRMKYIISSHGMLA